MNSANPLIYNSQGPINTHACMQARAPNINFANPMIQRGSINTCKHAHTYPESTLSTIFANRLLYNSQGSIYTHNSISANPLQYNSKGSIKTHTDTKTHQTRNKYKFKLKKKKDYQLRITYIWTQTLTLPPTVQQKMNHNQLKAIQNKVNLKNNKN